MHAFEAHVQLTEKEIATVHGILRSRVPQGCAWVFGSRASGQARPFSDLDLGIEAPEALNLTEQAELTAAFENSDLPFRVDVVDLKTVDPAFAERVLRTGKRLFGQALLPQNRRPG